MRVFLGKQVVRVALAGVGWIEKIKGKQKEQMPSERDAARENAAKLSGQVEAMQAQVSELMRALSGR